MKPEPQKETFSDQLVESEGPLASSAVPMKKPVNTWSVLRNRNYALLFWGQLISATGTQMQVVAVAWQVYLLTHSAVALGIIGLLQAIPRLLLSLAGGVFADRFDRCKLLLIIEAAMATSSVVLALCTHFRVITIAIIYIVVLISASVSAFEFPTRQAIIPTLVPRSQLANAFTLSSAMMQLTFVIGAAFGGYTVAWLGVVNTYWLDVFSYLAVIGSILLMIVPRIPVEKRAQSSISALIDGIHFLRSHPIILAVLSLDFFATFFGSPRALLPIYASDILHVGPQGLGILLAATSIGAVAFTPFYRMDKPHCPARIGSRACHYCMGGVLLPLAWPPDRSGSQYSFSLVLVPPIW